MTTRSSRSRGFGMIETIMVLTIAFTAMLAGLFFYTRGNDEQQFREANGDMALIHSYMGSMSHMMGGIPAGNYTARIATSVQLANGGPTGAMGMLITVYGQPITVAAAGDGTYAIILQDLPKVGCLKLAQVSADGDAPFGSGIRSVTSSSGSAPHSFPADGGMGGDDLLDLCRDEAQDVTFTIGR